MLLLYQSITSYTFVVLALFFSFTSPAFRQLNAAELWDPESVNAKAAVASRNRESFRSNLIFGGIMMALLLWLLWREYAL